MKYYGAKHDDGKLFAAIAFNGKSAIRVSSSYGLQYHMNPDHINDKFFESMRYEEITRKEFNDLFILQNKNMNQFIKEL